MGSGEGTVSGVIGTAGGPKVIVMEKGWKLSVRRATKSDLTRLATAADYDSGNQASQMRYAKIMFQWGVVGAEGVTDDDGAPVKFRTEPHPLLGRIACEALYDAAGTKDTSDVIGYVSGSDRLSEAQAGN